MTNPQQYPQPQQPLSQPLSQPLPPRSGYATAALVFGVWGLLGGFFFIFPPVLAVIFGHVALHDIKTRGRTGINNAKFGIAAGYSTIGIMALILLMGALTGAMY